MGKPRQIIDDGLWHDKLEAAERYYKKWEALFKCKTLEDYYEGFQWKLQKDNAATPYVFNEIYETIQIKIAQFIPQTLLFELSPSLGNSDFDLQQASLSASVKQDVLNTITQNHKQHFSQELEQAYKDHFFRFGMIEVGYESDWITNPRAIKPLLTTDTTEGASQANPRKVKRFEPPELPVNERIYFKHIPAARFRIGGMDNKYLEMCTWCGYYEWVSKSDLLALPKVMNADKIQAAAVGIPESGTFSKSDNDIKDGDTIKIWHLWHNKAGVRLILLDSPTVTIYQKAFKRLPLMDFRPDRRVSNESFYPIPPVFHWLSPQDEINETREQLKKHRRRFIRKFQVQEGMVTDEEIEKFESGIDGALVKVAQPQAISAIDNPDLGPALDKAIVTSSDDLNKISRTSAEVRGVADRTTATQANLINQSAQIGESADRDRLTVWYERIGRETLLLVRDKFTLGTWAAMKQNPGEQLFQAVQNDPETYKWVTHEDLDDGYDFKIRLDVGSYNSASIQHEQTSFLTFMAMVNQYPQIAMSPLLIREAAYRSGYRNERAIQEMQKMALLHQAAMMNQAGVQGQPQPGNPAAQQVLAQRTPKKMEQIRNQITNQVPGVQ